MTVFLTALGSAIFSGLVAILVTIGVEKCGGVVGGVLATVPSTIVPASIGWALQGDTEGLVLSLYAVPGKNLLI
jgi:hypothetical protein